jgi:hypothetical protein
VLVLHEAGLEFSQTLGDCLQFFFDWVLFVLVEGDFFEGGVFWGLEGVERGLVVEVLVGSVYFFAALVDGFLFGA